MTPQETRDRNITWVLLLGVVLVLLAGLILATSSWDMMGSIAKTGVIVFVSLLFFGLGVFSDNTLKIKKTAFAFWVLGSLFLPVSILSAGFFELFGTWLSIFGEGRFVLGALGAFACLPVYAYSSRKYENRFFTWLTLVTVSLAVVFLLAAFHPPIDLFYLGIALYNGLLVALYATKALHGKHIRFMHEFPAFVQINLFISTLFLLIFYHQGTLHGINLLLMATLYILMTFSGGRKEYGIVFSGLLIFGLWYIVESSPLVSLDAVLFALIGFLFLGFERYTKDRAYLQKTFTYASGFISLCTFLFINLRGILLNADTASFTLLFAHLLIAANYGYLAFRTKKRVFAWLAPLFLTAAGHQGFNLIESIHAQYSYPLHMFLLSVLMFLLLFLMNQWKFMEGMRASGKVVSLLLMAAASGMAVLAAEWDLASLILATLGVSLYLVYRKTAHPLERSLLPVSLPLMFVLSLGSLYGVLPAPIDFWYDGTLHFALIVLLVFLVSMLFRKMEPALEPPFFWAAQLLLPLAVLALFDDHHANPLLFLLPATLYLYGLKRATTRDMVRVATQACGFLYLMYAAVILTLFSTAEALRLPSDASCHVFPAAGALLAGLWYLQKNAWKQRTFWFFIPVSVLSVFSLLSVRTFAIPQLILGLLCVILLLIVLHGGRRPQLVFIPLLTLVPLADESFRTLLDHRMVPELTALILLFFLMKQAGELLLRGLLDRNPDEKGLWSILPDWYAVGALTVLPFLVSLAGRADASPWLSLVAPALFTFLLFSQRNRVGKAKKVIHTLWIVSALLPYMALLTILDPPQVIRTELLCMPLLIIAFVLSARVWPGREALFRKIQLAVLLFIAALLIRDILLTGSMTDALITGILALISVFVGMQFHIRSFFFVGSGTLLLNVLIQTQAFWASIPWWGYLLMAGLALIAIASLNEMQKNGGEGRRKISGKALAEIFRSWR